MHQEALTCLCQTWLATGFMGFIWLWSADEAVRAYVCLCERERETGRVCVCKYTFDPPNHQPAAANFNSP